MIYIYLSSSLFVLSFILSFFQNKWIVLAGRTAALIASLSLVYVIYLIGNFANQLAAMIMGILQSV